MVPRRVAPWVIAVVGGGVALIASLAVETRTILARGRASAVPARPLRLRTIEEHTMKRTITSVLVLVLTTAVVAACGSTPPTATTTAVPEVLTIEVVGEKPVDGVAKLKVRKGDRIHFIVESDSKQAVHLHGYDIAKSAAPGEPAEFDVKATIDGGFEAELEDPGVQILQLTVEP